MKLSELILAFAAVACLAVSSNAGKDNIKKPFAPAPKPSDPYNVNLEGTYVWERIFYVDNRGQKNTYEETRIFKKTTNSSYSNLRKITASASLKLGVKGSLGGAIEIVSANVENSLESQLSAAYSNIVERRVEVVESREITRKFTVGENSVGQMYRLTFNGPGVVHATDMFSTKADPVKKVKIICRVRNVPMLKAINVTYTETSVERPDDLITDTLGGSPDINYGYGGKYVWLTPIWTFKLEEAVKGIQLVAQEEYNPKFKDLAAGAGGSYRYLKLLRDSNPRIAISRVGLLRYTTDIYAQRNKHGWEECTQDINGGRQGGYLYLCWNKVDV